MDVLTTHVEGNEISVVALPIVSAETCLELSEFIASKNAPVFVEMDDDRWDWTTATEERDLVQMIRSGDFDRLKGHLAGTVIARRFSFYDGVRFDDEFVASQTAAEDSDLPFHTAARDQTVAFQRAWRLTPFGQRASLLAWFMSGLIRAPFKDVGEGRSVRDVVDDQKKAFTEFPAHTQYVEENAQWLASAVRDSAGPATVVVRPHTMAAVLSKLESGSASPESHGSAPPQSFISKALPWLFSAAIVTAFVLGFVFGDFEKMEHAVWAWVIINGTLAGIGTIIAGGHVVTVVCTALTAPLVSLNPAVGAGMVGAFVQALVRPPTLSDIQNVGEAVAKWRGWWSNRLAQLILIFILANLFSTIGSFTALAWFPAF